MTGGPIYVDAIGIGITFPVTVPSGGTAATRGIVRVKKPTGALQSWTCTVSGASSVLVNLLHVAEDGDVDEVGNYSWAVWIYDGPDADDLLHRSVEMTTAPQCVKVTARTITDP